MKIFLTLLCTLYCFHPGFCQQNQPGIDTVYLGSREIKELLLKSNYTRIPDHDLDEMLDRKISNAVSDRFNSMIAIIGSILGIIALIFGGILANRQKERFTNLSTDLKEKIKNEIDKEIDKRFLQQQSFLDATQRNMSDRVLGIEKEADSRFNMVYDNINDKVNSRIGEYFNKNFRDVMDKELLKVREELQKSVELQSEFAKQLPEIEKIFIELKLERIKKNVDARIDFGTSFKELKALLKQAEKVQSDKLIADALEELSTVSFYLKKDDEFEKIISEYISRPDIDIKENTLVNTALATLYSYRNTRDVLDRNKTLEYLNRALRKVGDYGEALGLKLELFAMDYEFSFLPDEKTKAKQEMAGIINFINSSGVAAQETLKRLDRVQASTAKSVYISKIFELFPDEMETMRQVANTYLGKLTTTIPKSN
jgi:hypothetical protein